MTQSDVREAATAPLPRSDHVQCWYLALVPFFAVQAAVYVPEVFSGPASTRPFAINSVSKDVVFTAIVAVAAADLARRARLLWLVIGGLSVIALLLVLAIGTGNGSFSFPPPRWLAKAVPGIDPTPDLRSVLWLALDLPTIAGLLWLLHVAKREGYGRPQPLAVPGTPFTGYDGPSDGPGNGGPSDGGPGNGPHVAAEPERSPNAESPDTDPTPPSPGAAAADDGGNDRFIRRAAPPPDPSDAEGPLTPTEACLARLLRGLAGLFLGLGALLLVAALALPDHPGWAQVGFVVGSLPMLGTLAALCAIASANLRRFDFLVTLAILAELLWFAAIGIVLIAADTSTPFQVLGGHVSLTSVLLVGLILNGAIAAVLLTFHLAARRARFRTELLPPMAFEALAAMADVVVVRAEEQITPAEVARRVDHYMAKFEAQKRILVPIALCGLWLYPVLRGRAPFPLMAPPERQRFVERRILRDVSQRRLNLTRTLVEAMVRLAHQMAFLGYYSDERTFESVGYTPFSKRGRPPIRVAHPPLHSLVPSEVHPDTLEADVVVVGSGAGGSMIAYRMAQAGRRVLVLEGGKHTPPSEFSEDEVDQLARLYADGALQLTTDFSFQILQGKCVGGSTTVNNAVCFELPPGVLERWNGELEAGLDANALKDSFDWVSGKVGVQTPPSKYLQAGGVAFEDGVKEMGLDAQNPPWPGGVVRANIDNCIGSGYCNMGCPFGNKLSALVTLLPEAQALGQDRLRILPECHVQRIEHKGGRVQELIADLPGRRVKVRGKVFVVSAGAVASPWLLMQSGIARGRAGRRLGFNMASPVTAVFGRTLDSFDGVQISHYLEEPNLDYVVETWFNPVVSQALNMPGWLHDHWRNMHRLRRLTAAGVLVGTRTEEAHILKGLLGPIIGPRVRYTPGSGDKQSADDFKRLLKGLEKVGEIYFAAGAERVIYNTFEYHEFTDREQLPGLKDLVKDVSDLFVGTGHPQCGNAISVNKERGVVGPECKVHDFENLYVCDASVFPSAITVNPQLTVMAVANMAAGGIALAAGA